MPICLSVSPSVSQFTPPSDWKGLSLDEYALNLIFGDFPKISQENSIFIKI
jgi:hypothetical protein